MQPHLWLFFHYKWRLPILEVQIQRIIYCVFLCIWFLSLGIMSELYPRCCMSLSFAPFYSWVIFHYWFILYFMMNFDKGICPLTTTKGKTQCFHHLQNSLLPLAPFPSVLFPPMALGTPALSFIMITLAFLFFHVNGITHCVVFCVCFYLPQCFWIYAYFCMFQWVCRSQFVYSLTN